MPNRRRPPRQPRRSPHSDLSRRLRVYEEGDLYDLVESKSKPFLLILDHIQDPHNLGACLRSANAAGVDGVVGTVDRAAPLTETVRQIASGAAEHTPYMQVTNLARSLKKIKEAGIWIVGTTDQGKQTIYDIDLKGALAIVVGSEGRGMRRLTVEQCDFLARIPTYGQIGCLNVSVAAGICLFEAVRQRQYARSV